MERVNGSFLGCTSLFIFPYCLIVLVALFLCPSVHPSLHPSVPPSLSLYRISPNPVPVMPLDFLKHTSTVQLQRPCSVPRARLSWPVCMHTHIKTCAHTHKDMRTHTQTHTYPHTLNHPLYSFHAPRIHCHLV